MSLTVMPPAYQTVFDSSGDPISGALIWTYLSGTSTAQATYTTAVGNVANTNPIVADSSGRFVAFLTPGSSYTFVFETAATPPAHGTIIMTVDLVSAVPAGTVNLDLTGTAGEALTAGQAVYLSDGSGSKVAGLWYIASSANAYSSSSAVAVGMVPSSIANAASGTIRIGGQMTGLSVVTGTTYYVGTAGALTSTSPTNRRVVGIADSTTTLVLAATPGTPTADNGVNDFRLTLTTGVPVTTSDVTAATTVYCTPYKGNRLALFDSAGVAALYISAEFSIAVPATTSTVYDIFAYSNSGVPTLELLAWTNATTRATAIVLTTTGVYTKSADLTRRYLGTFETTAVSGQTEDSLTKRFLWNYYHRVRRPLTRVETTGSWTYTSTTFRQANAAAANQVDIVVGVAEVIIEMNVMGVGSNTDSSSFAVAIGEDSTSTAAANQVISTGSATGGTNVAPAVAWLRKYPAVGRHFYAWLEAGNSSGTTTTTFRSAANIFKEQAGLTGTIEG